jgi:hypothetical protein
MEPDIEAALQRSFLGRLPRGVLRNPLTSRSSALLEDLPQVKRGTSHSGWEALLSRPKDLLAGRERC